MSARFVSTAGRRRNDPLADAVQTIAYFWDAQNMEPALSECPWKHGTRHGYVCCYFCYCCCRCHSLLLLLLISMNLFTCRNTEAAWIYDGKHSTEVPLSPLSAQVAYFYRIMCQEPAWNRCAVTFLSHRPTVEAGDNLLPRNRSSGAGTTTVTLPGTDTALCSSGKPGSMGCRLSAEEREAFERNKNIEKSLREERQRMCIKMLLLGELKSFYTVFRKIECRHIAKLSRMDGRTNGRTDGRIRGRLTDRCVDGLIDRGRADGRICGRTDPRTDGRADGRTKCTNAAKCRP